MHPLYAWLDLGILASSALVGPLVVGSLFALTERLRSRRASAQHPYRCGCGFCASEVTR